MSPSPMVPVAPNTRITGVPQAADVPGMRRYNRAHAANVRGRLDPRNAPNLQRSSSSAFVNDEGSDR